MRTAQRLIVTRLVPIDDVNNFARREVTEGELVYAFTKPTYGCINYDGGIAVTWNEDGDYPFFEFPRDAVADA